MRPKSGFNRVTLTWTIVTMTTRILPYTGLSTFSVLGFKFNMNVKSYSEAEKKNKTKAAARRTASYKNRSLHVVHTGSTMVSTGSELFENIKYVLRSPISLSTLLFSTLGKVFSFVIKSVKHKDHPSEKSISCRQKIHPGS